MIIKQHFMQNTGMSFDSLGKYRMLFFVLFHREIASEILLRKHLLHRNKLPKMEKYGTLYVVYVCKNGEKGGICTVKFIVEHGKESKEY